MSQGETVMRTSVISIAVIAALIAFAGMPSTVAALTEAHFASAAVHQQFRVKDAVRTVHPIHAPLFAP
jgi:hypothetical protein